MKKLCTQESGTSTVLQGNIAFAAGCVRSGIHAVDGYPGTPSTEVIDKGLSQVQDMITVGWSVNEAVAVAVGHGHSLGGNDCVVTMKIPGLLQAGDTFTSAAFFNNTRGALVYYIASDFTPSSTQHLVDPRPLIKSCFTPIFEPRNHQEMHEAAEIAANLSRLYDTPVAIIASGILCHSEGLVQLSPVKKRKKTQLTVPLNSFNTLPNVARLNYNRVVTERYPRLIDFVESSPLNRWEKGSGKTGIITCGASELMVKEMKNSLGADIDILSLAFTFPLPINLIRKFHATISGKVYIIEDGYRYLQEELAANGLEVIGKETTETLTEWTPALVAEKLDYRPENSCPTSTKALIRPPMICPGCPYRLFGETVRKMKKRGKIEHVFGDIGCNTLLYFMDATDTNLCMGASEANRAGFVMANPDKAAKCLSLLGDGTETHSGLDATRNTLFRKVAGIKCILDNNWTAMTGGQPGPTSPVNLAGDKNVFDLQKTLVAHGAKVLTADGYNRKEIESALKQAQTTAENGDFSTLVVTGVCIRKVAKSARGTTMQVNRELCVQCGLCQICPGILLDKEGAPQFNNNCTGCMSQSAACAQMCPKGAISPEAKREKTSRNQFKLPVAPTEIVLPDMERVTLPEKIAVAIRGVGGQGNLFFGKVLTQMAFLAGYGSTNIVKGETHGMAQMGGPVISTFSCGKVCSPTLLPGTADCLISMEKSEILRPGFIEMLKPGGTVLLADTRVFPYGLNEEDYPTDQQIKKVLTDFDIIEIDVLKEALTLGDTGGRSANVVMMGALSRLEPFSDFLDDLWLQALKQVSPKEAIWQANYAAFTAGRKLLQLAAVSL